MIKKYSDLIKMFEWNAIDILAHGANTLGGVMGAGIALSLKNKYPEILQTDIDFEIPAGKERLGNISICPVINKTTNKQQYLVNAYTQASLRSSSNTHPFQIDALKSCLDKIYTHFDTEFHSQNKIRIGFPYIGSGLGGGNKEQIEKLFQEYADKWKHRYITFLIDFDNDLLDGKEITSFRGEYGFLSNFTWLTNSIEFNGYQFQSVEAAYMAAKSLYQKNNTVDIHKWISYCAYIHINKQSEMKKNSYQLSLNEQWDIDKIKIMHNLVSQKFNNNSDLCEKLLNTGNRLIIENNHWNDRFWGVCKGKGQNMLGRILMDVRDNIKLKI